ncbi:ATP-binding cassette domain-containing protein [Microbacterium sp. 18062]|uniref:ATP-binding cassette domain-containing protein n=1 Tax=Microbacterium sp. 18062 TaxID=2681410 RepID=UPI00190F3CC5
MPLEVKELTKTYGTRRVLSGVSFTASPGRVTGFLGPNGSGKTTTARIALGLAKSLSRPVSKYWMRLRHCTHSCCQYASRPSLVRVSSPCAHLLMPDGDSFRPAAPSASDMVRKSMPTASRAARMFAATWVLVMPGGFPLTSAAVAASSSPARRLPKPSASIPARSRSASKTAPSPSVKIGCRVVIPREKFLALFADNAE